MVNFGAGGGGNYDPRGAIRTLLTALIGNNWNPVGLGYNPPTALGPSPVRAQSEIPGLAAGATPGGSDIWSALGPIIAALGGGGSHIAQTGQVNFTPFLQTILQSVLSPAAPAPTRAVTPPPAPAATAPSAATSIYSLLFGSGGGGGTDFGGFGGGVSSADTSKGPASPDTRGGIIDTGGLGTPAGERGPGVGVFGQ